MADNLFWHLYLLEYRLKTPLHIGHKKVLNLLLTREYIPAKPFRGALVAKFARDLGSRNYDAIGNFFKKAMRFGYFYILDKGKNVSLLAPKFTDEGLKFGMLVNDVKTSSSGENSCSNKKEYYYNEFAKKYITSQAFAAIDPNSLGTEEGMLHEVEFISPYTLEEKSKPVLFRGLIWVSNFSDGNFCIEDINENDFTIRDKHKNTSVNFSQVAGSLQIGGERKYGFGLFELYKSIKEVKSNDLSSLGFSGFWEERDCEVYVNLKENSHIWSHAKCCFESSNLKIKGEIEPFIGRDWSPKGAGRKLNDSGFCWVPGSVLEMGTSFKISNELGLWEAAE